VTGNNLLGLPAVLIFFLLSYLIIRSRRVSWIDVVVFVLFGFYLGQSGFAHFVSSLVSLLVHLVGGGSS
jgi:hypothetical protein